MTDVLFFSSRRRHTRFDCDWSSDVCSSDLNVGLLKHASIVPQSALMIEEIFHKAGFPDGVFQTLLISSQKVDRVLGDPRVAAATLTGSEGAGRSEEHTSELQSQSNLVCRLLLEIIK